MTNIERELNQLLEEHRHESGLHMIGGQRRLLDRLVQFFEEQERAKVKAARETEH